MQTQPNQEFDIIVIGGGPAGSTVGSLLAGFGKRVLVLEKEVFPRYHIGESLLSGTANLMKKVGALEKVEASGAIRKYGVQWIWGSRREPWTVYFKDALAMPYDWGYQVERGAFDKVLLDNARDRGVDVRQNCRVVDIVRDAERVCGVAYEDSSGTRHTVTAPWTIDGSGQGGYITKQLNRLTWDPVLRNMAVWSYWKGVKLPSGIDRGNTVLTTFPEGWLWFIPLTGDVISIGAVMDRDRYVRERADGLTELYHNAIKAAPELAQRLQGAECVADVRVQRDWSYSYDRFWGKGYVSVGDAACFIDPLLSTGVHLAMLSGYLASVTVNTIMDKPDAPVQSLLEFYESTYKREVERLKAQIYFLYGGQSERESAFWKARDQFHVPGIKPEQAFISLIAGAWEHRSWYHRFLKNLDVPDHLRDVLNGAFDAKSVGPAAISLDTRVASTGKWSLVDDFGIEDKYLSSAKTLRIDDGTVLPMTPTIKKVLDAADGTRTITQIVDALAGDAVSRDEITSTVHKIVSYGVLAPAQ